MTEGEQNRLLYCETNLKNKEVEKGKNKQASWVSPVRERLWEASLTLLSSSHKRSLLPSLQCNSEPGGVLLWKGQTEEKHKERSSSWFSYILEVRGKLPGSAMRARGRLQAAHGSNELGDGCSEAQCMLTTRSWAVIFLFCSSYQQNQNKVSIT